jgi:predicted Rossmann fold nucleotide-binding protein DprA/Smf involved in DNA uptake
VQAVLDDPLIAPDRLRATRPEGRDGLGRHLSDVLPRSAAELAAKLALPFSEVLARLTRLELEGEVERRGPGYVRVTRPRGTTPRSHG